LPPRLFQDPDEDSAGTSWASIVCHDLLQRISQAYLRE
jgi:hypothetical protein